MSKLLVVPTLAEAGDIIPGFDFHPAGGSIWISRNGAHLLVTGAGIPNTIAGLLLYTSRFGIPSAALHAGIAGVYGKKYSKGTVLWVQSDVFAEMGAENQDSTLIPMKDMGFHTETIHDIASGSLRPVRRNNMFSDLPAVKSITVQVASGSETTIHKRISMYNADIENMETAAFFFVGQLLGYPSYEAIRAVSNDVEPRNREAWQIETAVQNLSKAARKWLNTG